MQANASTQCKYVAPSINQEARVISLKKRTRLLKYVFYGTLAPLWFHGKRGHNEIRKDE